MLKRVLCLVILLSMILHCASRLGTLSFLFEKRHTIAYSIGLIAEVPIATCSSDYDFGKGLKIAHADPEKQMPLSSVHAIEINLFYVAAYRLPDPQKIILDQKRSEIHLLNYYPTPPRPIFHPPAFIA